MKRILLVSDPADLIILRTPCESIIELEYDEVFGELEDTILNTQNAAGLAAPQIGILKRAFVIKLKGEIYRFANPTIESGKYPDFGTEGCLSIPGREFTVERFKRATIKDDINGEQEYRNFFARVVQHEIDHTLGITLLESGEEVKYV